ncbi:unnamed protein product [Arctia plantaginis]|uniref:CCHC-type domain-containing protein n=1 Tax=Arctia plantaginis TaxID=874455 RepID=A0A8S1BN79_ARCPL|nr:unnamed protein product [Arctia plantaginis]
MKLENLEIDYLLARDSRARSLSHSVQELAGNSSAHNLRSRSPRLEQLIVSSPSQHSNIRRHLRSRERSSRSSHFRSHRHSCETDSVRSPEGTPKIDFSRSNENSRKSYTLRRRECGEQFSLCNHERNSELSILRRLEGSRERSRERNRELRRLHRSEQGSSLGRLYTRGRLHSREQIRGPDHLHAYELRHSRSRSRSHEAGHGSIAADNHLSRERTDQPQGVPPSGMSDLLNNPTFKDFVSLMTTFTKHERPKKLHFDKSIILEFDPTVKNHRIETWISKVNECAQIYGWDDKQTSHFALPRLVGHAKKWYEGLQSLNRNWSEWQKCLKRTFPSETNYGALLSEMLDRRYKPGESLDEYYYDKLILLNACNISEKKAVDCIIYGLDDRTLKASASSARFHHPEDLLGFLKDMCRENTDKSYKTKFKNNQIDRPNLNVICNNCKKVGHHYKQCRSIICFNCKQQGHRTQQCAYPIIKCDHCHKLGHKSDNCFLKNKDSSKLTAEKRVMKIELLKTQNKFYKTAVLGESKENIKCFIDFGSDCSLIKDSLLDKYGLKLETGQMPNIKGFANLSIKPIGKTYFKVRIDSVEAFIVAYVILSDQLHVPLLIGQNFTELPHVLVIKTNESLELIDRNIPTDFSCIEHETYNTVELFVYETINFDKVAVVPCYSPNILNVTLFVPGCYRCFLGTDIGYKKGYMKLKMVEQIL